MMTMCNLAATSWAGKLLMEAALMQSSVSMYFVNSSQDVLRGRPAHLISGVPPL